MTELTCYSIIWADGEMVIGCAWILSWNTERIISQLRLQLTAEQAPDTSMSSSYALHLLKWSIFNFVFLFHFGICVMFCLRCALLPVFLPWYWPNWFHWLHSLPGCTRRVSDILTWFLPEPCPLCLPDFWTTVFWTAFDIWCFCMIRLLTAFGSLWHYS